ncbi:Glucan endo-1,3-beta-glucosidase 1 [Senna tora]|uniref:Glucan endo-1,3-beta-glucosidase 1 n=1 Tax=Senna tora TaxID=362788 RepID=A0A834WVZ0_9FABA|nr:Glucan endo-1,3-beta-glucosidase 1 [Senna tora]
MFLEREEADKSNLTSNHHFTVIGTPNKPEKKEEAAEHVNNNNNNNVPKFHHETNKFPFYTTKRDITTPIPTIPNLVPTSSSSPILNPNSNPDVTVSPSSTIPPFSTTNSPPSSSYSSSSSTGSSWCVATPSASQSALQVALDYACGLGGADCSAIQVGGKCYNPNSVRDHASYAFNSYYQKNPLPNSCNFGGTAVITSTNPSSGACQFPSTRFIPNFDSSEIPYSSLSLQMIRPQDKTLLLIMSYCGAFELEMMELEASIQEIDNRIAELMEISQKKEKEIQEIQRKVAESRKKMEEYDRQLNELAKKPLLEY